MCYIAGTVVYLTACMPVCLSVRFYVVYLLIALVYSGTQLEVLANDVLAKDGAFTDYTDTDGNWNVNKSNGNPIDLTVWTRCVKRLFASLAVVRVLC